MISDTAKFHGAALISLLEEIDSGIRIRRLFSDNLGFYILNEKIPIFLKYASKRESPWSFTFHPDHLDRYRHLNSEYGDCLMIMICGSDGIVALDYSEMSGIVLLDRNCKKSISIARKLKHMYCVSGTDGVVNKRISKKSLFDLVKQLLYKDEEEK